MSLGAALLAVMGAAGMSINVQRGTTAVGTSTGIVDVPIDAVDPDRALVLVTSRTADGESGLSGPFSVVSGRLTDGETLRLQRGATSTSSPASASWEVIEFSNATVQTKVSSLADTNVLTNVAISAVELTKAFVVLSAHTAYSAASVSAYVQNLLVRAELTSATNLRLTRRFGPGALTVVAHVVEVG